MSADLQHGDELRLGDGQTVSVSTVHYVDYSIGVGIVTSPVRSVGEGRGRGRGGEGEGRGGGGEGRERGRGGEGGEGRGRGGREGREGEREGRREGEGERRKKRGDKHYEVLKGSPILRLLFQSQVPCGDLRPSVTSSAHTLCLSGLPSPTLWIEESKEPNYTTYSNKMRDTSRLKAVAESIN